MLATPHARTRRASLVLGLLLVAAACDAPTERPRGVVMEAALAGALSRAGVEAGDRLISWRRRAGGEESSGPLTTPLDLWWVEHEQAAYGTVELRVSSDGDERWAEVPPGRWYVEARPTLPPHALTLYREARAVSDADDAPERERRWRRLVDALDGSERVWALVELGKTLPDPEGERTLTEALAAASDVRAEAHLHFERGHLLVRAGRYEDAIEAQERALELSRSSGSRSAEAITLAELGRIAGRRGDPAEEERLHREALAILEDVAPESLELSRVLRGLARARATQDDVDEAFVHARRALVIAERLAPGGFDHEAALMVHGIFHWIEEDWPMADARLIEALEIVEALDPEHEDVGFTLHNLGLVASYRGDHAQATEYLSRALDADRPGDPIQRTKLLNTLGTLALNRYDLQAAERWFREVLQIREALTPGTLNVATPLLNLGEVELLEESFDAAERYLERALELQRQWIPDSRDPAMTLLGLAQVSEAKGDLETAAARAAEALGIVRERFPGVLLEANIRHTLGTVLHRAGRSAEAEVELKRARALLESLAPDTTAHALAVYELGRVAREAGRLEEAVRMTLEAASLLERQVHRLGGSDDVRSRFRGHLLHVYRDGIELLLEMGRPEDAFHLLERSQARSLLALLAERGIDVERGSTPEVEARRAELSSEYDELSEELAGLSYESDPDRVAEIAHRVDQVRLAREELRAGDERGSVLASVQSEILDVDRALAELPDDTVALSYAISDAESRVFILGPGDGFRVVPLGLDAAEIEDRVERLLLLVERPGFGGEGYRALAARLFDDLVAPAQDEIERSRRLVIVPDGPLHLLPFSVLFREEPPGQHLVEWRSLQIAPSLTVLAALQRRSTEARDDSRVVAFADPGVTPGVALEPLPHARMEAEGLRRSFGESTLTYVGSEATEGRAKALDGGARIVHFATHGVLDPSSPLDSGLVLQPSRGADGKRDNGLLQAWEIFDGVRISAELVTLSACESAAGLRVAGEGLMSLTRAFQFAGARSVVASLWRVSDASTALLMERFYDELASGTSADEALRAAQLSLLHREPEPAGLLDRWLRGTDGTPDHRHPYYWAAFQLYGPGTAVGGKLAVPGSSRSGVRASSAEARPAPSHP